MTSTTTTIELDTRSERVPPSLRRDHESSGDEEEEDILATSRIADSTVPDGGYGWVVVAAGAVLTWWAVGTTYAWGVMQTALVDRGLSSPAVLSFIGGINASFISVLAIVNSRLVSLLGTRKMSAIGIMCMGGSELLSGFSVNNLGAFFFTGGVLMGTGIR